MSAAMEALRARQMARRAARSSPSVAKLAAPCPVPKRTSVLPWGSHARRCNLESRIASLWGAQSRQGVACRSTTATAADGAVDTDADVIDDRVPITVITGFLGSGKTTLLNNILTQDHGQRIAVIENEFGEIDIDSELVASVQRLDGKEEQRIMMLNNGCLCCTVREDLVGMLNELVSRRDQFDRVVIETTGVANPAPIIQTFFLDPDMAASVRLDGIVTMVDAKHVGLHLDEQKPDGVVNEALQQIAYADRLVLNKTDLATPEELDDLEARLRDINSLAQVVRAERARVGVEYVLGVGGFDLERVEEEVNPDLLKQPAASTGGRDHDRDHGHSDGGGHDHSHAHADHSNGEQHDGPREHSHSHASTSAAHSHGHGHDHHHHHHHHHDDSVTSVSVQLDGEMDLEDVNFWLGALIQDKGDDLYRMKGVIAIRDFPETFVFQGVHSMFEGMPGRPWKDGEPRTSRMVFIGKDLNEKLIREGFQRCLMKEPWLNK